MSAARWLGVPRLIAISISAVAFLIVTGADGTERLARPNVVLIITDDQGYGDLGCHGNPVIQTPRLDRLAAESVELANFYVCPVCAPTRSALLTGRYNYRTGVTDTYLGRARMHPDEVTLAERLAAAGYRTGIFGKWHLGDNYPLRPIDQGFQESLVHRGGGIGQASDPPEARSYFDPVLFHDGQPEKHAGYVSDVITAAAIDYIGRDDERPFFVYLAFNAPHTPLEVPKQYSDRYDSAALLADAFPKIGQPLPARFDTPVIAKVYGMVSNIDENVGRLLDRLESAQQSPNTIVVFLTDNGPQQPRFNGGLRGLKGTVYDGGIRVPCFLRQPGTLKPGKIDRIAAHIDLTPTILAACGVTASDADAFDGRNLWPLLRRETVDWPDRTLFLQWHRGNAPEPFCNFAARTQEWKLLRAEKKPGSPVLPEEFELYRIAADPYETQNVAALHPEIVERLRNGYEAWMRDVSQPRGYGPIRIVVGSDQEPSTTLTRQDWRLPDGAANGEAAGAWHVTVDRAGKYRLLAYCPQARGKPVRLRIAGQELVAELPIHSDSNLIGIVKLAAGETEIVTGPDAAGVEQLTIERLAD